MIYPVSKMAVAHNKQYMWQVGEQLTYINHVECVWSFRQTVHVIDIIHVQVLLYIIQFLEMTIPFLILQYTK